VTKYIAFLDEQSGIVRGTWCGDVSIKPAPTALPGQVAVEYNVTVAPPEGPIGYRWNGQGFVDASVRVR
jgi:hypothetical protein